MPCLEKEPGSCAAPRRAAPWQGLHEPSENKCAFSQTFRGQQVCFQPDFPWSPLFGRRLVDELALEQQLRLPFEVDVADAQRDAPVDAVDHARRSMLFWTGRPPSACAVH